MTTNDKTGEKLLASIRKTKEAGGPIETAASPSSASAPAKRTATAKRKAPPKARAKTGAAKPAATRVATPPRPKAAAPAAGPYQSARRVWPDCTDRRPPVT